MRSVRDQLLTGYFCSAFSPSLRFLRALRRFIIKESWGKHSVNHSWVVVSDRSGLVIRSRSDIVQGELGSSISKRSW